MSGRLNLALAVIAMQHGNKDDCLSYMAKAAEFGDDLTQFVSEVIKPPPRAARNDSATPSAENTIAPSLAATASSGVDFTVLANRLSRITAVASALDEGDEMEEDYPDETLEAFDLELDTGDNGVDEDEEDAEDDEEFEDDTEAVASSGPVRYKR